MFTLRLGGIVEPSQSSSSRAPRDALGRSRTEARQSYLLLAFGILVALVLPYLLHPRAAAFSSAAGSATASPHAVLP